MQKLVINIDDEPDVLAIPSEIESLKLFNPYHDSLGRFASKSGSAIKSGIKGAIERNKRTFAYAGALAAIGLTGVVAYTQYSGDKVTDTVKAISGTREFTSNIVSSIWLAGETFTKVQADRLHLKTLQAEKMLHDMGFNVSGNVFWHRNWGQFAHSYKEHAWELITDKMAEEGKTPNLTKREYTDSLSISGVEAFADSKNSQIHMSPLTSSTFSLTPVTEEHKTWGVPLIAHELFHNRKSTAKPGYIEEALATVYETVIDNRLLRGERGGVLNNSDFNRDFWDSLKVDSSPYGKENVMRLLRAAAAKKRSLKLKGNIASIVDDWAKTLAHEEIKEWIEKSGTKPRANIHGINPRALEDTYQLFNPYHDNLGRFTSGPSSRSAALFGFGKSNVGLSGKGVAGNANKILDRVDKKLYSGTTDPKIVTDYSWDQLKRKTNINSKNFLGAFIFDQNEIVISPSGLAEIRRQPKLLDRIMTHESIHARKRSGNSSDINFINSRHAFFEEGLTDLIALSPVNNTVNYNYQASPYYKSMQGVARQARINSGNNVSDAWKWITQSHYYNDEPKVFIERYNTIGNMLFSGTGTNQDIEWLFSNTPKRLEEEFDEEYERKMLQKSEIAKWKALGIEMRFE